MTRDPIQLHVAHESWPGEVQADYPFRMNPFTSLKPAGFWTSTETTSWTSAWCSLCDRLLVAREKIRWPPAALVRFVVVGQPEVFEFGDDGELLEILEDHGLSDRIRFRQDLLESDEYSLDEDDAPGGQVPGQLDRHQIEDLLRDGLVWDRVTSGFDAFRFCPPPRRFLPAEYVDAWECESTVWFRPYVHLQLIESRTIAGDVTPGK